MDRGTYAASSGGLLQFRKLEVQNNNLANINTVGFKRKFLTSEQQEFDSTLARNLGASDPYARPDHTRTPGAAEVSTLTDFSQGPIKETGNPFDVALRKPNDFFVVNTPEGTQYTRAGDFTLDGTGTLVTPEGYVVQGDGGAIQIQQAGASFTDDGQIFVPGVAGAPGTSIGRLQVVRFDNPQVLQSAGGNRFTLPAGQTGPQAAEPELVPRSLEMANVSAVSGMVELIVTNRAFEAYTKASQTIDQMNQSAISQIGRR